VNTIRFNKRKQWEVACEPHVSLRAKRVFGKISKVGMGHFWLSDTRENARDLEWFCSRYPFDLDEEATAHLKRRASEHRDEEVLVKTLLANQAAPPSFDLAVPAREYQCVAATMALGTGGLLLADEVGLGKTVSAICTFTDPTTLPALVVTLTHLPRQWEAEINRFTPKLRTHIVKKGTPYDVTKPEGRKRKGVDALPFPDVLIMNYAKLGGWAETLAPLVRSVVFDECQELRTGPGTSKYEGAEHVSRNARLRTGLSATPIFNYGGEIWNVINVLRPGVVGERHEFDREWGRHLARDNVALSDPRAFGYYAREAGIMLRRTRRDVGRELPPLSNISQPIEADEKALDSVSDACAELARAILAQGEKHRGEKWMASEDFSNTLRQATGIAKAPFVAEFVKMLVESGERVLLFGWHHAVYDIWRDRLAGCKPVMFTGTETEPQKHRSLEAFKAGEAQVLIMSLRSGAGVDGLQHCCRTVVYGELDWSPMVHEQCSGRVSRDGQPDPVMAYYLVSEHGADPIMADVLGLKRQQSEGLLNPDRPLVVPTNVDPSHVRRLAVDYLERKGIPIPKEEPCDHSPSPVGSENNASEPIRLVTSPATPSRTGRDTSPQLCLPGTTT
jgi:superfamily II DNA or RNA helicase